MGMPTPAQIEHIEQYIDRFEDHAGKDRTPAEYLTEYANYKDGDIYERLCHDLGIEPIQEDAVSSTVSDVEKAQMMLSLGMGEDGGPLSDEDRADLEKFVAENAGPVEPESAADPEPSVGAIPTQPAAPQGGAVTPESIQQMIAQQLAQAGVGAPQGPVTVEQFLQGIDPRDSETALALLQYLFDTQRLSVVGTLNGGGYMMHYTEPKGTTKAGYVPGGTQGGRMVDRAVEEAKASGAKARKTGMCDKCWSAVELLDDGTVILDDGSRNASCTAGGGHTFNG